MGGAALEGAVGRGLPEEPSFVETPVIGGRGPHSSQGWEVSGRCPVLVCFLFWWESLDLQAKVMGVVTGKVQGTLIKEKGDSLAHLSDKVGAGWLGA